MRSIGPPDNFHLSAAVGWLELGNLEEARADLARVAPEFQDHPHVLDVWWAIAVAAKDWAAALETGRELMERCPDLAHSWLHHAYALRRVAGGGLQAAWDALQPALEKFPEEPTVPYNLACYACQMQQLDAARALLQRAFRTGGPERIKQMALHDSDLEPLWPEIRKM